MEVTLIARTLLTALLAAPSTALAGVGVTAQLPPNSAFESLWLGYYLRNGSGIGSSYPSFDIRSDEFVVQIQALETLTALTNNDVYLGADAFMALTSAPIAGSWEAFLGFGGSADLLLVSEFSDTSVAFGPIMPVGLRIGDDARLALYVVLGLDVIGTDEVTLAGSGALKASVWF